MNNDQYSSMDRTRSTLIHRLKDIEDGNSWMDFYEIYWPLLLNVAKKSGLSNADAEDVSQEALFRITKAMPKFEYVD